MYKRIKVFVIVFISIMGLLALRLAYIQILGNQDLSAAARTQQNIVLNGADSRGVIYDRNGAPIAGGHQEYIYIIRSENYDGETQNALNAVNAQEVENDNNGYRVFASQVYNKNIGKRLINNSDAYILEADRRYQEQQPAVHMIGYVNEKDNHGVSGLELMYDEELSLLRKQVSATADVNGVLLQGYGLNVKTAADDDYYIREGITTTLELGLQLEAERILAECDKNGSIVVMNIKTGEILASASTPVFDPRKIEEYMESDNGELVNKVVQGTYPPGSVFKIVVAAAALTAGVEPDRRFVCEGKETVNGHSVKCETGGQSGHGEISFKKAFADSCNCVFIQLGEMIGADAVINMAEKLGLGQTVLDGFPEEQQGNIMSEKDSGGAAIANLCIGQGETLVTPLQIAAMTSIVANDGINPGIKIIKESSGGSEVCISSDVADKLQEMMAETMSSGTGRNLETAAKTGAKTGSAESTQNDSKVVHGWITGYVPEEDPVYAVTVFVEDGKSGRKSAGPLFTKVIDYLNSNNMLQYEADF